MTTTANGPAEPLQINSSQIASFLAVARTLNFTRAAEELYVSQPVLSRRVAALENELGVQLVERSSRSVALTSAGVRFAELFGRQLNEVDDLLAAIRAEREEGVSRVALGVFEGWDLGGFIQALESDLQARYGHVEIAVTTGGGMRLQQGLERGDFDALIMMRVTADALVRIGMLNNADLDNLFYVRRCLVYSDRNPLCGSSNLTLADFRDQTMFCLDGVRVPSGIITSQELCKRAGFTPRVRMMDSIDAIETGVLSGAGYAILDDANTILDHRRVHHIMLDDRHEVCLVTEHPRSLAAEFIRNYLLEQRREGVALAVA